MKKIVLSIACLIPLFSCNQKLAYDSYPDSKIVLHEVDSRFYLYDPQTIHLMDHFLVISDRMDDDYFFSLIDTVDFKLITRFGRQGMGPNEIGRIGFINKLNSDSLLVYDLSNEEASIFSIKNISIGNLDPIKHLKLKDTNNPIMATSLIYNELNGQFLGTGLHAQGRYASYDANGNCLDYWVEYPELDLKTNNELAQALAYFSVLSQNSSGNRIAGAGTGFIDLLAFENGKLQLTKRINLYRTKFTNQGSSKLNGIDFPIIATDAQTIVGINTTHFQCSDRFIYYIFSFVPIKELAPSHSLVQFDELFLLNWEGLCKYHFLLSHPVIGFAVDENTHSVFYIGLNENKEFQLYKSRIDW